MSASKRANNGKGIKSQSGFEKVVMESIEKENNPFHVTEQTWKRIEGHEKAILKDLAVEKNATMRIGKRLVQASQDFGDTKEGKKMFNEWCLEKLDIKKAQKNHYMRVYEVFGEDSRFDGVSLRVLVMLCPVSDEIRDKAAKLAESGTCDSRHVEELLQKKQPESNTTTASYEGTEGDEETENEPGQAESAGLTVNKAGENSVDSGDEEQELDTITALKNKINELLEAKRNLESEVKQFKAEKTKPQYVPPLFQFSSNDPITVLGLGTTKPKLSEVHSAADKLQSIWKKDANRHEWTQIETAKNLVVRAVKTDKEIPMMELKVKRTA